MKYQREKVQLRDFSKVAQQEQQNTLASIRYAKRIQDAILTDRNLLKSIFGSYSIVYEPRDIVSGDFYYAQKRGEEKVLFVGDCTGHGVPGALMSILCNDMLIRAVKKNSCPSLILERVNGLLEEKLMTENDNGLDDGMDCSLAIIDYKKNKIRFSGAKNDGVLIRKDHSIELLKATRKPIGRCDARIRNIPFSKFETHFEKGDLLYLFSDGYQDQFNKEGVRLGKKGLIEKLSHFQLYNLDEQQNLLDILFQNLKKETTQIDDVLVLGVRL